MFPNPLSSVLSSITITNLDIARILGRSEGAVKSLYHRTLSDLRDLPENEKLK